jgi:hypothetical protein
MTVHLVHVTPDHLVHVMHDPVVLLVSKPRVEVVLNGHLVTSGRRRVEPLLHVKTTMSDHNDRAKLDRRDQMTTVVHARMTIDLLVHLENAPIVATKKLARNASALSGRQDQTLVMEHAQVVPLVRAEHAQAVQAKAVLCAPAVGVQVGQYLVDQPRVRSRDQNLVMAAPRAANDLPVGSVNCFSSKHRRYFSAAVQGL